VSCCSKQLPHGASTLETRLTLGQGTVALSAMTLRRKDGTLMANTKRYTWVHLARDQTRPTETNDLMYLIDNSPIQTPSSVTPAYAFFSLMPCSRYIITSPASRTASFNPQIHNFCDTIVLILPAEIQRSVQICSARRRYGIRLCVSQQRT
jgi:hypothetical protein